MSEIYTEAIRLINFPFSLLMVLITFYWVFALVGVLDLEVLDFMAPDLELDIDLELDTEAEGHALVKGSVGGVAGFLHLGEAPLTVILSLLTTFMWSISMFLNHYFNQGGAFWLGLLFLIPNFIVSITATGIAVIPVAGFFRRLNGETNVIKNATGQVCTVLTTRVDHESGQAEVSTGGAPITVNARTSGEGEVLTKGQKAVVVRKNDNGTYIIKSMEE